MLDKAKKLIVDYYNEFISKDNGMKISEAQVFIVWSCKILKNWKVLAGTHTPDNLYYEITHNGNNEDTYIDVYDKCHNVIVSEKEK